MKRALVAPPHGTGHWVRQRLTAVLVVIYTLVFLIALGIVRPSNFDTWRAFFGQGWLRLATVIFFFAVFYHAWVGMRDILMDYVKPAGLRLACFTLSFIVLLAYAAWAAHILWGA